MRSDQFCCWRRRCSIDWDMVCAGLECDNGKFQVRRPTAANIGAAMCLQRGIVPAAALVESLQCYQLRA